MICIVFQKVSSRLGIPALLAFIVLGMLLGSDGLLKIPFDNYGFAEKICSVALIFIMFYGGFGMRWQEAKKIAVKATLLSSVGVVLTACFTGLFCYFVLRMEFWEGILVGSVLSSTDAASVFSILRSKRLNLKYRTAPILEMESGSNDPFSYMLTVIVLSVMAGNNSAGSTVYLIFAQIAFGLLFGFGIAFLGSWLLKHIWFSAPGVETIFIFALAILSYTLPSLVGGNGYLSVYIVGIVLGNCELHGKKALVNFFDVFTGLMQMTIFFLLGLLAFPSQIPSVILPSLGIALFLTFLARPVAVALLMTPFKMRFRQQCLISWAGLRGAASIVFAILATVSPAYMKIDVFHITFTVVLFSILLQGSLLPLVAKKLKMINNRYSILKTFNDYSENAELQFVYLKIERDNEWVGKAIKELVLPPDMILMAIRRGEEMIAPKGGTVIEKGDICVLGTAGCREDLSNAFHEMTLNKKHHWCRKKIKDIQFAQKVLIVMVRRRHHIIIPNGHTRLYEGDVIVMHIQERDGQESKGIISKPGQG